MITSEKSKNTILSSHFEENHQDIVIYFNTVFNNTADPIFVEDEECKLLLVNDAFCCFFGLSRNEIIGKTREKKMLPRDWEQFLSIDKQVLQYGKEGEGEEIVYDNGLQTKNIVTRKNRFVDHKGKPLLVGVIHDITHLKQTAIRQRSHNHALALISRGEPLPVILDAIVRVVEQENPDMLCRVLLLNDEGKQLLSKMASSLPDIYNDSIHGIEIGEQFGSCGTSAFINQPVIAGDIQTHPYWVPFKDVAKKEGVGRCWSQPIRSSKSKVLGTFAIYHNNANDPTDADLAMIEQTANLASIAIEKKQTQETLVSEVSVFTHAHQGVTITDVTGTITEVNDSFSRITGYTLSDILGNNTKILQSGCHSPEFFTEMWNTLIAQGHWRGEVWVRRKNNEIHPEMLTISAVKNTEGQVQQYVSLFTDICSMKGYQDQLERIAHFDLLTNLPNSILLADRLRDAMVQSQRNNRSLTVAFMDLDGFKEVNDTFGRNIGDKLLVAVSKRMQAALREGDTLARINGDEFVAVMINLNKFEESQPVLERLLKAASEPFTFGDAVMQVSASIGTTFYPQDNVDADLLIRHADQAMYVAKQAGKNHYHQFDTALENTNKIQRDSISDIFSAMDKREFVLHYQPKVNMQTGEVIGVEALIRWQHPVRGLIQPLEFLPVIEGHTVSLKIGEWVISTALTQISQWQSMGVNLPISVNISPYQLQQDDFAARLTVLLAGQPKVNPNSLELEVLETGVLTKISEVTATMNTCQELGVRFSLDDFGMGYSSLNHIKQLPAHLIKIDKSFVIGMLDDAEDLAIVQGVVGLAKAFQREVIAEGLETLAHGAELLQIGCFLAQGFAIARPMPADEIPKWLSSWKKDGFWL